jgi:hypothetical protein
VTWRDRAACAGSSVDFFDPQQTNAALAICAGCHVRDECLTDAYDRNDRLGVRGGHSFHPKDRTACGTTAGYKAHARAKEAPCDACRQAQTDSSKARRAGTTKGKAGRPPSPIDHGTMSGFRKHWRRGEKACDLCVQANRRYEADRRARGAA